jgi:hypothetical protein
MKTLAKRFKTLNGMDADNKQTGTHTHIQRAHGYHIHILHVTEEQNLSYNTHEQHRQIFVISDCRKVAENCDLLGYCTVTSSNFLPMFWDNLYIQFSGFKKLKGLLNPEDWTDRLSTNIGDKLPLLKA